jgi:hypothetical protein
MTINDFLSRFVATGKLDDPSEISAAIARLEGERTAAQSRLTTLDGRRPALLLADDNKALDADQREAERACREIEKIDLVLPELKAKLAAAKNAARQERWTALKGRYSAALDEFTVTYGRENDLSLGRRRTGSRLAHTG